MPQQNRSRTKVSATLAADLVKRVAKYQRESGLPSFSAALEDLLWKQILDEQAKAYYLSMSEGERSEQEAWAKFTTQQLAQSRGEE